jgi:two-component system chemotaxis response regulator CheB
MADPAPASVLIVDDSRCFRAAIEAALAGEPDLRVVGSVFSGEKALELIDHNPPQIVTLDVDMPGMDGLQTLQAIQARNASLPAGQAIGVLMVSGLTRRGADITMQALRMGAFDFMTKPSGDCYEACLAELRRQLTTKIRAYLAKRHQSQPPPRNSPAHEGPTGVAPIISEQRPAVGRGVWDRRRAVRVILIASSTGGPHALNELLPDLCQRTSLPILIVQHLPPMFTTSLAEQLQRHLDRPVHEAADQELIQPQHVYIAPGGRHLVVRASQGSLYTGLSDDPPENHCRPSANRLFRTAAGAVGAGTVAIILTGMGNDGTLGLSPLKRAGAHVIVQDEASSVVWGMPGSVVAAGLADQIKPLHQIAEAVESVVRQREGR